MDPQDPQDPLPRSTRTVYIRTVAGEPAQLRLLTRTQLDEARDATRKRRAKAAKDAPEAVAAVPSQTVADAIRAMPPGVLLEALSGSQAADLDRDFIVAAAVVRWGEVEVQGHPEALDDVPGWVIEELAAQVRRDNVRPTKTSRS